MIKKIISIITISAALLPTYSCKKQLDAPRVESITLDITSLVMDLHDEARLTASILPENAKDKNIIWGSDNEQVVNVYEGRVKAVGYGEATISAVSADGNAKAECKVNVRQIAPNSIRFENSLYETRLGLNLRIMPILEPESFPLEKLFWKSSNESVAKIDRQGNITPLKAGFTYISAGIYGTEGVFKLRVNRMEIPYGAVDLGLPSGNLWAKCNIGTNNPYRYGGFYAWGELQEKSTYSWDNYKFGTQDKITKYVYNGPGVLQKEDDVANFKLGVSWYIPKLEEINELFENTDKSWEEDYLKKGIAGFILKSKIQGYEEYSIFIPAAGNKSGDKHDFKKYNAFLWTSQNGVGFSSNDYEAQAIHLQVTGNENKVHTDKRMLKRNSGFNIRPVRRPE